MAEENNFCINCGTKLKSDTNFCVNCGTKVNSDVNSFHEHHFVSDNLPVKNFNNLNIGTTRIRNFVGENDNITVLDEKGPFQVIEYEKDLSVDPSEATLKYFSSKMNIRPRQLVVDLKKTYGIYLQAGAMQWMNGSNKLSSGIKGVGDFGKKFLKSKVTGESTVKPEYSGDGYLVTEQTYKHLILLDLDEWNNNLMLDDGLFLAAEKSIELTVKSRTNLSSALAASEGLFNTVLVGSGYACLESTIPFKELIIIELENDTVSIDGPMAIAWTSTLDLTVEKSGKSFLGSAVSGEGLVNVYRGTGKILMAPLNSRLKYQNLPTSDIK